MHMLDPPNKNQNYYVTGSQKCSYRSHLMANCNKQNIVRETQRKLRKFLMTLLAANTQTGALYNTYNENRWVNS